MGNTRRSMPTSVPHLFARVGELWQGGEPRKCSSRSPAEEVLAVVFLESRTLTQITNAHQEDERKRREPESNRKRLVCVRQRCVPKIFAFFLVFITYQVGVEGSSAALYAVQDASMCQPPPPNVRLPATNPPIRYLAPIWIYNQKIFKSSKKPPTQHR